MARKAVNRHNLAKRGFILNCRAVAELSALTGMQRAVDSPNAIQRFVCEIHRLFFREIAVM